MTDDAGRGRERPSEGEGTGPDEDGVVADEPNAVADDEAEVVDDEEAEAVADDEAEAAVDETGTERDDEGTGNDEDGTASADETGAPADPGRTRDGRVETLQSLDAGRDGGRGNGSDDAENHDAGGDAAGDDLDDDDGMTVAEAADALAQGGAERPGERERPDAGERAGGADEAAGGETESGVDGTESGVDAAESDADEPASDGTATDEPTRAPGSSVPGPDVGADVPEDVPESGDSGAHQAVPDDVRKYDRFQKMERAEYDRVNEFLRDRTYVTAREWAIARLCADFRTETGVEMTKIGENLPRLVPFMTDTYTPQAVNQARASFEDKVSKAGATFLYGAMCGFFTAEQLDDMMYEVTEVAKFLLEVEGVDLAVEDELEAEDRISSVMREVRQASAEVRGEEVKCPECGHVHEPKSK